MYKTIFFLSSEVMTIMLLTHLHIHDRLVKKCFDQKFDETFKVFLMKLP